MKRSVCQFDFQLTEVLSLPELTAGLVLECKFQMPNGRRCCGLQTRALERRLFEAQQVTLVERSGNYF